MAADKKNKDVIKVPELNVSFDKGNTADFPKSISNSEIAARLIRSLYDKGEIEFHEVMFVIYLNRSNQPIGYYKHSIGGIAGTVIDTRIILGTALKSLSSAIIVAHNHPSGKTDPSQADKQVTKQLQDASKLFNISVLDHVIVTKTGYSSLADKGLMGIDSPYPINLSTPNLTQEKNSNIELYELEAKAIEIELLKF